MPRKRLLKAVDEEDEPVVALVCRHSGGRRNFRGARAGREIALGGQLRVLKLEARGQRQDDGDVLQRAALRRHGHGRGQRRAARDGFAERFAAALDYLLAQLYAVVARFDLARRDVGDGPRGVEGRASAVLRRVISGAV